MIYDDRVLDPNVRLYRLLEEWLDLRNALEDVDKSCEKVERQTLTFCINSLKSTLEQL
jgi:hypothetical protein